MRLRKEGRKKEMKERNEWMCQLLDVSIKYRQALWEGREGDSKSRGGDRSENKEERGEQ